MLILLDEIADFRDITSRFPAEFGFTFQIDFFHDLSIFPDQHVVMTTTLILGALTEYTYTLVLHPLKHLHRILSVKPYGLFDEA